MSIKIKKGDNVKILTGKDKGKTGTIVQVLPGDESVVVEGLNMMTKNLKRRREGEKGERIKFNAPLDASNVMVVCGKCNKPTRIGVRILAADKKKERFCKRCQQTL